MTSTPSITQKDIARITGFSVWTVRRNEKLWGIFNFRSKTGRRSVRYRATETLYVLRERGLVE